MRQTIPSRTWTWVEAIGKNVFQDSPGIAYVDVTEEGVRFGPLQDGCGWTVAHNSPSTIDTAGMPATSMTIDLR